MKYGEVSLLTLNNIGCGCIQFKQESDFNKILAEHDLEGKITITNTDMYFNVEKFRNNNNPQANKIVTSPHWGGFIVREGGNAPSHQENIGTKRSKTKQNI